VINEGNSEEEVLPNIVDKMALGGNRKAAKHKKPQCSYQTASFR